MNYIKNMKRQIGQHGTTLVELTAVIGIILLLMGVMFIGFKAWKNGANAAACIVNLSTIQKAVRGYASISQLNAGSGLTIASLQTAGFWGTTPTCPAKGNYTFMITVPSHGTAYATCSLSGHVPTSASLANW